jgi:two-component system, NarL family, response regulator YdfI
MFAISNSSRQSVESAACAKTATTLTKIFILADSTAELARLTTFVRSESSLEFVGGGLDRDAMIEQLDDTDIAEPVLVIEHSAVHHPGHFSGDDFRVEGIARILLTGQSGFADAITGMKELDSAIRAILPAWASDKEIYVAIEAVSAGLIVIHPEVFGVFSAEENERIAFIPEYSSREQQDVAIQPLTPRESEILNLLADGLANKEIAWRLKISEHTVKFHITSIFNKVDASTRAEAVAIGARRGLIIL